MEFSNLRDETTSHGTCMSMDDVRIILNAQVLCLEDKLAEPVNVVCGCDLISDVLAFTRPGSLLLTGLTNIQVIKTAEILDLRGIVFVRDKKPDDETIKLAVSMGIPLLSSPYPLYESCGLLYSKGLRGYANIG